MKRLLATLLIVSCACCSPAPVHASHELIASGPRIQVILTDAPCTSEKVIKAHPKLPVAENYGTAIVTWQGKHIEACYIGNLDTEMVEVVDESGDSGAIPITAFRRNVDL